MPLNISDDKLHELKQLTPSQSMNELKKPANANTWKSPSNTKLIQKCVDACLLFESLNKSSKQAIMQLFFQANVPSGTNVCTQGEAGKNFFIVESGAFDVIVKDARGNSKKVASKSVGSSFGELALMSDAPRNATCKASQDSVVWVLSHDDFRHCIDREGTERTAQYLMLMQEIKLLAPLEAGERDELASALEEVEFEPYTDIFTEGEMGDAMYLIVHGEVRIHKIIDGKEKELARIGNGTYFGERALLTGEPRAASITTTLHTLCLRLDRSDFDIILGPLEELLKQRVAQYNNEGTGGEGVAPVQSRKVDPEIEELDRSILFEDLEHVHNLANGVNGIVTLVKHVPTNTAYALKTISKHKLDEGGHVQTMLTGKHVLASIKSPFLCELKSTFTSQDELYMLMEPYLGGDLLGILKRFKFLVEPTAKFYAAQIVLVFEAMHSRNYAYRDLQSGNILFGSDGYCRLIDLSYVKKVHTRTFSLCGSPEYLAPEVVTNKGHGKAVDWWALGILIHEMLTGVTPFFHEDFMQMYTRIANGAPRIPHYLLEPAKDIISSFLTVNPTQRLGTGRGGLAKIQRHRWFNQFNWERLKEKKSPAPHVPKIHHEFDVSYFNPPSSDNRPVIPPYVPHAGTPDWAADF